MKKSRRYAKHDGRKRSSAVDLSHQNVTDSQNFITNAKLIHRIIGLAGFQAEDTVLEIGTGKGHLTEALCRSAGKVCSVEIDRRLYESAGRRLSQFSNLKLIHGDFLKYDLPAKGTYRVFANIPYFITTQIIEKLTQAPNTPAEMWLVMEKGAAKRFLGIPKETKKSLLLKAGWDIKIVYHFRREDFHPMPAVDSVLVHFAKRAAPDLTRDEYHAFQKFVEQSMKYGICGKGGPLTRRQVAVALKQAGLPHAHEDGVTLYIQWLCLFRWYQRTLNHRKQLNS